MEKSTALYRTEYTDNYTADRVRGGSWNQSSSGLFDGKAIGSARSYHPGPADASYQGNPYASGMYPADAMASSARDPAVFASQTYPSVYRENVIHKDDRGKYVDPFKTQVSTPCGRRLVYDKSHPDKMYASQWSSELADNAGCYSFPTTTGLNPDIPFKQDLNWQCDGEQGSWPTNTWKNWTQNACSPPYDGHDDQVEYSKYKVSV